MTRSFFSLWGTHVAPRSQRSLHTVVIRVGTLEEPAGPTSQGIIWARSAPAWVCLGVSLRTIWMRLGCAERVQLQDCAHAFGTILGVYAEITITASYVEWSIML